MILCIDIGNSNTVLCVADDDRILNHWRIETDKRSTSSELGDQISNLFKSSNIDPGNVNLDNINLGDIKQVIVSSVVPELLDSAEEFSRQYCNTQPYIVRPEIDMGMPVQVDIPEEVGADRVINAIAAYEKYSCQGLIVIDFGTATTFDCVSPDGAFIGGAIAPGIVISSEALFNTTSKLPRIDIFTSPDKAIAGNTVQAMKSGILYGYIGLVEGMVKRMKREAGFDMTVIATGGLALTVCGLSNVIDHVEEFLTLEGMIIVAKRNRL